MKTILDILETNAFSLFVVELYNKELLEKTRTFQATLDGFLEALQYVISLPSMNKRLKAAAIIKMILRRGGEAPLGNGKSIKWYYLP